MPGGLKTGISRALATYPISSNAAELAAAAAFLLLVLLPPIRTTSPSSTPWARICDARTGVGEGAVRNMLFCLRRMGLVNTVRRGNALTPEGASLVEGTGIEIPAEQPGGLLGCGSEFVLLAHGKGHLMDPDIRYRNGAILMGASVCMPFRMDDGKVTVPYYDAVQLEYPDLSELAERIGMRDGDAGMLCGAASIQVASSAAFGGMLRLLG